MNMPGSVIYSGEGSSLRPVPSSKLLPECLYLISLLTQFKDPQVRSDFSNGMFKLPCRSENVTLRELDLVCSLFLPSWVGIDINSVKKLLIKSNQELLKIAVWKIDVLVLGHGVAVSRTYAEWYAIILDISKSSYWRECIPGKQPLPYEASSLESSIKDKAPKTAFTNTDSVKCLHQSTSTTISTKEAATNTVHSTDVCEYREDVVELVTSKPSESGIGSKPASCYSLTICPSSPPTRAIQDHSSRPDNETVPVVKVPVATYNVHTSVKTLTVLECTWCHKRGHSQVMCWKRKGLCLICGNNHHISDCPRYIPPPRLTCSTCSGPHLGSGCKMLTRLTHFCHWCGKRGHTEDSCWVKAGACLVCGSAEHKLRQCPRFVPREIPVFPPWCAECGSHHLGADCESPYME